MCSNVMMIVIETEKPTSTLKLKNVHFTRMASKYFRQLSDFIIPVTQIRLIETIGQGMVEFVMVTANLAKIIIYAGEFGIVYRGLLQTECGQKGLPRPVAVKTLKGIQSYE